MKWVPFAAMDFGSERAKDLRLFRPEPNGENVVIGRPTTGSSAVMVLYGVATNAPFIAIQRYNRARVARVLARRSASSTDDRAG